jgi:hypothetical protein
MENILGGAKNGFCNVKALGLGIYPGNMHNGGTYGGKHMNGLRGSTGLMYTELML